MTGGADTDWIAYYDAAAPDSLVLECSSFQLESIDNERAELVSYDGRRVPFDLCT